MHGVRRKLEVQLLELLDFFPAVALLGPRQCGKTTLALEMQEKLSKESIYLDAEKAADLQKLEDAVGYLRPLEEKLVIIDEVQNRPSLFPELRGLIDEGRRKGLGKGRFLLLGSASYELLQQSGESLAGRIAYLELTPFRGDEVEEGQMEALWLRGGFPDSFLAPSDRYSTLWRENFLDTYLGRDLGAFGRIGSLSAMRDLLQMIAHLHGQVLNVSRLVEAHEFHREEINRYLDLFEQTFMIRRLQPYYANVGKRLTKRPKIYLRDSGLLHYLFQLSDALALRGHPCRGESWEGFVIEQVISMLPDWSPYYYRTSNGAELDLVMVKGERVWAFEIKASTVPKLTKGFHTARADVKPEKIFVVSQTDTCWETSDGIQHVDLPGLIKACT